ALRAAKCNLESTNCNLPAYTAQRLPDGSTRYAYTEYNLVGNPTLLRTTNQIAGSYSGERTMTFTYDATGIDLIAITNYAGETEGFSYNSSHRVLTATNEVGE